MTLDQWLSLGVVLLWWPFWQIIMISKCVAYCKQFSVVRCKNCKWWNKSGCAIEIVDESDRPHENDFCSFGERRDDCE